MLKATFALFSLIVMSTVHANESFTVMAGKDASAPKQPQAYVSADGLVHVTFGIGEQVFYCTISGEKCTTPKAAFRVPNMSLGMRRGPRIAHFENIVTVTAIGGTEGKGRDGDILAYRSADRGETWLGPVKVNDVQGSAREGLHAMTCGNDGVLWCVWLDLRDKGTKLYTSKSTDHGASWSKNVLAYESPDGSVCECCHPSILASGNSIRILFRNSLKGDRDMYLVTSIDSGRSFDDATRLGRSNWKLHACPMDGGMLAVNQKGELQTVWRRDRSVFSSGSKAGSEEFLSIGEQPWIAGGENGFFTVWTSRRDGELFLHKTGGTEAKKLAESSGFPVVVSTLSHVSSAYVLWENRSNDGNSIMAIRIP